MAAIVRLTGQVVLMMSTEQGAWWETLFGTDPSKNRLAPVIPLLPTTIRSAPCSLGHVQNRVSRIALARIYVHSDSGLAGHSGGRL